MTEIHAGDVVTIMSGTTTYDVTAVSDDMARIWPRVEDDTRDGQWIGVTLLTKVDTCACGAPLSEHIGCKPCVYGRPNKARGLYDLPIFAVMWRTDAADTNT